MISMRIFYYFGNLKWEDRHILLRFLSGIHNIHPIISRLKEGEKMRLDFIINDVDDDVEKIVWKKFREPRINKYITAHLYKYGKVFDGIWIEWRIVEGSWFTRIDYETYTIFIEEGIDKEKILELANGNLGIFPFAFEQKGRTLII